MDENKNERRVVSRRFYPEDPFIVVSIGAHEIQSRIHANERGQHRQYSRCYSKLFICACSRSSDPSQLCQIARNINR